MVTLKAIRFLVGLVWVGIFLWGVVSLFQGQWLALVIAVVLWIIVAFVFMSLHDSLQRLEISHVSELAQAIGFQTAVGAAPALRTAAGTNPHFGVAADVAVDVVDALADEGPSPDPAVFKQLALALNQ